MSRAGGLITALLVLGAIAREARPRLHDVAGPWSAIERAAAPRFGDGAASSLATSALCSEFGPLLERRRGSYALPARISGEELFWFLYLKQLPSESRSTLARAAARTTATLEAELQSDGPRLRPAELLQRGIAAADGDVAVGVLACHNLLKEVTLRLRAAESAGGREARVAARVAAWRTRPLTPSGEADALGPLYHLFAAMTAGVWGGSPWLGRSAEYGEALLRLTRQNLDRPDPEKGEADRCGANVAFLIQRLAKAP